MTLPISYLKLSVSNIKKYYSKKAEWAGQYILGIRDFEPSSSMLAGSLRHLEMEYLYGKEELDEVTAKQYEEAKARIVVPDDLKEEVETKLNALRINYEAMPTKFEGHFRELRIDFEYQGQNCLAICDMVNKDESFVVDYKSAKNLTKIGDYKKSLFSKLGNYGDYELQAWFYMLATSISTVHIVEVRNAEYRTIAPAQCSQIITFQGDEEFMSRMEAKFGPIIQQLLTDYNDLCLKHGVTGKKTVEVEEVDEAE